jgi:integrase
MTADSETHFRHPKFQDLHIFRREGDNWFAGFHCGGKYYRKCTRSDHLPRSLKLAEEWYLDQQAMMRLGQFPPASKHSVGEAAKIALERFQRKVDLGERSQVYLDSIELLLEKDVLPFFGAIDVKNVGPAKWAEYEAHIRSLKPKLTRQTLHQHRNALRVCLNAAVQHEWIERLPTLKLDKAGKREEHPRVWFEKHELRRLLKATREHVKSLEGTRWVSDGEECYDFILWMANTGMRVGEARNVRFCDVVVQTETGSDGVPRQYCLIKNIKGKRGTGECRSWYSAYNSFRRIVERRGINEPSTCKEKLFLAHHRDMFNEILNKAGLKYTNTDPVRKRDFVSLRQTYIASRLISGVPVYDVALNCRTSVAMIENHYARYLSPRYLSRLNQFAPLAKEAIAS